MYVAMIIRKYFLIIALLVMPWLAIPSVSAADKGWFNTFTDNVAETWRQPEHYDLYVPAITWHAHFAYDKEKTDRYNERPWGVGFGQSRWDDKGNWHGLYMMAFKDSFNKWEPIGGYGWEKPGDRWKTIIFVWDWALPQALPRATTGIIFPSLCCCL